RRSFAGSAASGTRRPWSRSWIWPPLPSGSVRLDGIPWFRRWRPCWTWRGPPSCTPIANRGRCARPLNTFDANDIAWNKPTIVGGTGGTELLNVSYDPTRELYRELNGAFIARYEQERGVRLTIKQSHGGSGSQARAVIDGLDADVVKLALHTDVDAIRAAGKIDDHWEARFPAGSLPYYSTIVFVVRAGNPKAIRDWRDLVRPGVQVRTPHPEPP